jgi:hypothetical protein
VTRKCSICGETDPLPVSLCLAQLTRSGPELGKPCQYSVEGQERTRQAMIAHSTRIWAEIEADRAARKIQDTGGKDA